MPSRSPAIRAPRAALAPDEPARRGAARDCGPIRPSRRGRWRALSLILLHVAVGAHVLHWYLTGRTLTPLEPSEAMQTLGQGLVNAGFVLFALLILSTLVLGRFFCGWGCHVVALQDLCSWLLKRAGIRPRPFRSRLLVFVPLFGALYMFVAPTVVRLWVGESRPPFQAHFTTDNFWATFPGLAVALLTFFVCGFLIVVLLGNKGFCTYGCPYGGIFALADRVAPGKIRVTDACEGCAHCTATCTSNVRVHEEVRLYGMVVDSGCMKCMDCISVCPKDALYYGFGAPALVKGKPSGTRPARSYDFTWGEEAAMALLFFGSLLVLRGLYEAVPFLLALGLSSISAYVLLTAFRMFGAPHVGFARFHLRRAGSTTRAGAVFLGATALWVAFLAHSALVQYASFEGNRRLSAARALGPGHGEEARRGLREALALLLRSERLGLFPVVNLLARIGSAHADLGDLEAAERYYRRAVAQAPGFAMARYELARFALGRNETDRAIAELREVVRLSPELPGAHAGLADLLARGERPGEGLEMLEGLMRRRPHAVEIRLTYGIALAQSGAADRGLAETRRALAEAPDHPQGHFNLARILASQGSYEAALASCSRAADLRRPFGEARTLCAQLALRLSRPALALMHLDEARRAEPANDTVLAAWSGLVAKSGGLERVVAAEEERARRDPAALHGLVHLYRAAGRAADADRLAARLGLPAGASGGDGGAATPPGPAAPPGR